MRNVIAIPKCRIGSVALLTIMILIILFPMHLTSGNLEPVRSSTIISPQNEQFINKIKNGKKEDDRIKVNGGSLGSPFIPSFVSLNGITYSISLMRIKNIDSPVGLDECPPGGRSHTKYPCSCFGSG